MAWQLSGRSMELCSCKMLCPCWLGPEGVPDQGWCGGALGFDIERGSSDGVDLSGTRVAFAAEWPGNFFDGKGTARLYISEAANAAQRHELEVIFSGKKGGLFEGLWGAVISNWLPTETTAVEIGWGDSPVPQSRKFRRSDADGPKGSGWKADARGRRRCPSHISVSQHGLGQQQGAAGGLTQSCANGKEIRGRCTGSTGAPDPY